MTQDSSKTLLRSSDGSSAHSIIAKFTPMLSPAKQQAEWRWWIQFYRCFGDYYTQDIRILQDLLSLYRE